jgi:hypothetical protein
VGQQRHQEQQEQQQEQEEQVLGRQTQHGSRKVAGRHLSV